MTAIQIAQAIVGTLALAPLLLAVVRLFQLARLRRTTPTPTAGNTAKIRARSVVVEDHIGQHHQDADDEMQDMETDEIPAVGLGIGISPGGVQ